MYTSGVTRFLRKTAGGSEKSRFFGASVGVTPVEFCRDVRHQKTRVHGLLCGVVCVILPLAVSVEHRLATDGQTDRQTHDDS